MRKIAVLACAVLVVTLATADDALALPRHSTRNLTRADATPATAPPGYIVVTSDYSAANESVSSFGAYCPSNTVIYGGGAVTSDATSDESYLINSFPELIGPGWSWQVSVENFTGAPVAVTVYAICAKKPKGYKVVHKSADNLSGTETSVIAKCPKGRKVLGGGGSMSNTYATGLGSTYPSPTASNQWIVKGNNQVIGGDNTVTSWAICGEKVKGLTKVEGTPVSVPSHHQSGGEVTCPGVTVPISGGVSATSTISPPLLVNPNSIYPDTGDNSWGSYDVNGWDGTATITPWVICAGT